MTTFSNREIAIGVWLLVCAVFFFTKGSIRKSLAGLVKACLRPKVFGLFAVMTIYSAGVITFLHRISYWDVQMIKETILWICLVGTNLTYNSIISSNKISFFRTTLTQSITVIMVLEFIVSAHTLPLLGELILIPIATLVSITEAFSGCDKKYSSVQKVMASLQTLIGLAVLGLGLSNAVIDWKNFGTIATLKEFFLPSILSIALLPFLYLSNVYISYSDLFCRLEMGYDKSNSLKRYARIRLILYCLLSLPRLETAMNMGVFNLMKIRTQEDVEAMIQVYRQWSTSQRHTDNSEKDR
jgi:hypothetical protein